MKKSILKQSNIEASDIALGCMRISEMKKEEVEKLIKTSMEEGINFFDHADIYGGGRSEEIFGEAIDLKSSIRDKIIIQSKCGIRDGFYDGSKDYILKSVDGILKRLNTEYLDILLIHRPDALMEPEEIGEAYYKLKNSGKIKYFGVSNHNPMQIELLNKYLDNKVIFNQIQFGVMHTGAIDNGINFNLKNNQSIDRDGSIIEYCRLKDINLQAWSPFQYGFFEGVFLDNSKFPEVNKKINELAEKYNVSNVAIATAWILRHPAKIQTILGSTKTERIKEICKASNIELSRKEWYDIYSAAGNPIP